MDYQSSYSGSIIETSSTVKDSQLGMKLSNQVLFDFSMFATRAIISSYSWHGD